MMNKKHIYYPYLLGLAISLEVTSYPRPGNTHRFSEIKELPYTSFIISSHLASKWFLRGYMRGFRGRYGKTVFGDLIYYIVRDTMKYSGVNTCLGSSTLLAPLSVSIGICVSGGKYGIECFTSNVEEVLRRTSVEDSIYFYRAVRKAFPTHLRVEDSVGEYVNIWSRKYIVELRMKKHDLYQVFRESSRREIVHDELIKRYRRSIDALKYLENRLETYSDWNRAVVETYLYMLSRYMDTVIVRKHGLETARHIMNKSREILEKISGRKYWLKQVRVFDKYLKKKGINPGSIADLMVSTIALYILKRFNCSERIIP